MKARLFALALALPAPAVAQGDAAIPGGSPLRVAQARLALCYRAEMVHMGYDRSISDELALQRARALCAREDAALVAAYESVTSVSPEHNPGLRSDRAEAERGGVLARTIAR